MKIFARFYSIIMFIMMIMSMSCGRHNDNIFDGAFRYRAYTGQVEPISGEVVDMDVIGGRGTWIADSVLFVSASRNAAYFVSVYSLNNNRVLYKDLLLKGRGPNEYAEAEIVHVYTDSAGVKALFSVDFRERLLCVDITESISQQRLIITKEIDINVEDKFSILCIFEDTDTSIVLQRIFNNDEIAIYNPVSGNMRSMGWLYTQEYDSQNSSDMSVRYLYHAQKSILAGGMTFFDQINFYSLKKKRGIPLLLRAPQYGMMISSESPQMTGPGITDPFATMRIC